MIFWKYNVNKLRKEVAIRILMKTGYTILPPCTEKRPPWTLFTHVSIRWYE